MDFEHILAFIGSAAGTAVIATVVGLLGREMGRKQLDQYLDLRRRRRPEIALETGGELTHRAMPDDIDWSVWGPGEMAALWRLMEKDGLKPVGDTADPDLQFRLIREMDEEQRRYRADLLRRGALERELRMADRYEAALRAVMQKEEARRDRTPRQVTIELGTPISRGGEVLAGISYVFAFGQMPLSPITSFDQRLSGALARIGVATRNIEQDRNDAWRRSRKKDER